MAFTPLAFLQKRSPTRALGLSNPDIEAIRQSIITAAPQDLAGDVIVKMQQVGDQFYLLGSVLMNPTAFAPGFSVGGGAGLQSLATGSNTMAQIHNTAATVQLGNPFSQTAMLAVRARRIDLPPDWAVDVSPAQITLAPGEQTTVTVRVLTGSPIQQGRVPRLAVEGYAGNQLLGGIAIDIVVPNYVFFDGKLHVYLPLVEK